MIAGTQGCRTGTRDPQGETLGTAEDDGVEIGPIQYIIVEFPGSQFNGKMAPALADLVQRGLIRILELALIRKGEDGSVEFFDAADVSDLIGELSALAFGTLGLLGEEDIAAAAEALEPGTSAGLLVWEDLWAIPFAKAARESGGELIAAGRIPVQDLIEALDALESE